MNTLVKLGSTILFSFENIVPTIFGSFYKISTIEKNTVFDGVSSISVLRGLRNNNFQREKRTHSDLIVVVTKKMKLGFLLGDFRSFFYLYDPDISGKEVFWNFESMATFALRIEIYLP